MTATGSAAGAIARGEGRPTTACLLSDDAAAAAALLTPLAAPAAASDEAAARAVWEALGERAAPAVGAFADDFWRGACVVRESGASQFDALR
ncbi:MAG: hypothetical protein ACYDIE_14845, partial [Candidatus Krumholzibacteriia bacterium]